jgi:hypothetical protein
MPRKRMMRADLATLRDLRTRYSADTIAREAAKIPKLVPKIGRPKKNILTKITRAGKIWLAVEQKRQGRSRFLRRACELVAKEAKARGEKLSPDRVLKLYRQGAALERGMLPKNL